MKQRFAGLFILPVSLAWLGMWSGNAMAVTCTSTAAGGNWNSPATWTGCAGGNGTPANTPGSADNAIIATTGAGAVAVNVQAAVIGLTINPGSVLNIVGGSNFRIRTSGATSISGALNLGTSSSSSLFGGPVTIASGGSWNNSGNQAVTFRGGISGNGSFTGGTGTQTFDTNNQALGGGGAMNFGGVAAVVGSVTITNNNTNVVTIAGNLTGNNAGSTWVNGANATLNYGGAAAPMGSRAFTANAVPNTVNYIRAGTQTVKAVAYYHLGLGGSSAKTMSGVTAIGGDLNISGTATMTSNAAFTVAGALNYTSSGATTLTAGTPISVGSFNLAAGSLADNGDTVTVTGTGANTWVKTGTFTATGTVNFTGAAPQIGASNFNNLTVDVGVGDTATLVGAATVAGNLTVASGTLDLAAFTADRATAGGTLTVANGATLKIGGGNDMPANYATHALGATSTVEYGGTDQSVAAEAAPGYGNLTLSGSGTKTAAGNVTVTGVLTLNGGTFAVGANTLTLNGPAIAGTPANLSTTSSSSLIFGGSATGVSVPGSVTALNNLTVNNANGISLGGSGVTTTLGGTLALGANILATGSNILALAGNCSANGGNGSLSRSGGYVVGNLRLTFPSGTSTCTYHVGSGSNYAPIGVTMVAASGGTLTGSTTGNEHPQIATSTINPNKDANRYWSLWLAGDTIVVTSYGATFNFTSGDLDLAATATNFVVGKYSGGAWSLPAPVTATASSTGVSSIPGPLASPTDFAVGEVPPSCTPPTDMPGLPAMTCVCDNFDRASLNPSTIYGQDWFTANTGGTFGNPRIVNSGYLRLTDNSNTVSTVANVPGTFPAAGNVIVVEFKHYAYNGTGADGMALTLSDSLVSPTPGAFGGSLGYAQKSNPGSDCTTPGGCPGFNGGWIGIAIDEYGNYSNNTEGRSGGPAPGFTPEAVAVRGSGSGLTGYPYLAGSATLTPGIDNPTSTTAAYGHAYRLMVDARNYTPTTRTALVSVDRDTSGSGASYTPLLPAFDAYTANPSQADVPINWKLSFTGSTGAMTNIHEIAGLKICAQAYTPPAGYLIQVDNLSPSSCSTPGGNPASPIVTVKATNSNGSVITNYTASVTLAAQLSGGANSAAVWSLLSGGGTLSASTGTGSQTYNFVAGDGGVAKFYLADASSQDVYLTVTESGGSPATSLATPVQYRGGSFTVAITDTLGSSVVAGRPHRMSVTRTNCGTGTDTTYAGTKALDGWYNPAAGDHPPGANAPQICNLNAANSCLPAAGSSCATLSIAPPALSATSNNLSLSFSLGVANFCLASSDVGKYSLGLRDDSNVLAPISGSSATLTARPFAVVVSGLMQGAVNNPANAASSGSIFAKAGTAFQATVAGYLWSSAGDTGNNGLPDAAAGWPALTAGGIAPHYADSVLLAAGTPFAPTAPPAVAGILGNGNVAVMSGSATQTTLNYNEVGSFTLTAAPSTNYLGSAINLGNRVAIFSNPASTSPNGVVGRFIPDHFGLLANSIVNRADLCPAAAGCPSAFTYFDEQMNAVFTLTAQTAGGATTQNYAGTYAKLDPTVYANLRMAAVDRTTTPPSTFPQPPYLLTPRISAAGMPAVSCGGSPCFQAGSANLTVPFAIVRAGAPDGAYGTVEVGIDPVDADGVTVPFNLDTTTATNPPAAPDRGKVGTTALRYGRIKLGNAYGSELLPLSIAATVQSWDWAAGGTFAANTLDSTTAIANAAINAGLTNWQASPATSTFAPGSTSVMPPPASVAFINGATSFRLAPPGAGATGSVDIPGGVIAPGYLQPGSLTGRATFGVYQGNPDLIYMRENY